MEDERTTEQAEQVEQTANENAPGTENGAGNGTATFDQMLQNGYQAEFDRRISKAINTARTRWEQEQADEQDEAKKLAKMNEAQRERYQLDKDKAAFAAQQAAFAAQQMQVSVGAELQKRGLDAGFAKYLSGKTAEESTANLDEFESLWNKAISGAVNSRMRGEGAPKDPKGNVAYTPENIRKMSRAEINANWDKISEALSQKG